MNGENEISSLEGEVESLERDDVGEVSDGSMSWEVMPLGGGRFGWDGAAFD